MSLTLSVVRAPGKRHRPPPRPPFRRPPADVYSWVKRPAAFGRVGLIRVRVGPGRRSYFLRLRELLVRGEARERRSGALARVDLMFSTPLAPWNGTWF